MSLLATGIAGLVFLWTAILKAISPRTFQAHLAQLGWVPHSLINAAVLIITAGEAAAGTALIVGLRLHVVIPIAILALVVLSATTVVAVKTGRTNDCVGCSLRVGRAAWSGPNATIDLLVRTFAASFSRRRAQREIARIERAFLMAAEA